MFLEKVSAHFSISSSLFSISFSLEEYGILYSRVELKKLLEIHSLVSQSDLTRAESKVIAGDIHNLSLSSLSLSLSLFHSLSYFLSPWLTRSFYLPSKEPKRLSFFTLSEPFFFILLL